MALTRSTSRGCWNQGCVSPGCHPGIRIPPCNYPPYPWKVVIPMDKNQRLGMIPNLILAAPEDAFHWEKRLGYWEWGTSRRGGDGIRGG